jgi:hypothetical protein
LSFGADRRYEIWADSISDYWPEIRISFGRVLIFLKECILYLNLSAGTSGKEAAGDLGLHINELGNITKQELKNPIIL